MDRLLGLFGLLILLGLSSLFHYQELVSKSAEISTLLHLNFIIFIGMVGFFIFLFLPIKYQQKILKIVGLLPFVGKHIQKLVEQLFLFGGDQKKISGLVLLSMFTQFLNILAFWILASPFFQYLNPSSGPLSFSYAFTFIPLGLVSVAIPITPSGIGVGHASFAALFHYFGVENGASLFNFYFLANALINVMGLIPYLFDRERPSAHVLNEELTELSTN